MLCLGIESTAHTFAVAVVRKKGENEFEGWEFLSNVRKAFTSEKGGMIPAKVSDHHVEKCGEALKEALHKAQTKMSEINVIAFSQGPGIGNSLRIGAALARSLALRHNIPLIGVNHCVAHLEIGRILGKTEDPVLLYASGANTQVIALEEGKYRVFGETLDTGIGNFLDTLGREMKMRFPAGPKIEEKAKQGKYLPLPYVVKGMDTEFSGLLSSATKLYREQEKVEDICFSVQENSFAMLTEIAERALAHTGKKSLVLGGGVACNERLQEMCRTMCEERNVHFYVPKKEYLVDNAAMIALCGIVMNKHGIETKIEHSQIETSQRTDQVIVSWR